MHNVVILSVDDPEYQYLIGKQGTVIKVFPYHKDYPLTHLVKFKEFPRPFLFSQSELKKIP